ncbi:MAG TPA: hypothetical protein GXZ22_06830 [Clostridiaceae bacterium]|jgi:hypothetical protein|nr:hypothetical protein [Clostridiaceae bacterium]
MNNQELDELIAAFFQVEQAILQLSFILSLIQAEIVRLTAEGNNQEEIDNLVQDSFVVTQVILQLTSILLLIQAEIAGLSTENGVENAA